MSTAYLGLVLVAFIAFALVLASANRKTGPDF